jgi:hypothetical protein
VARPSSFFSAASNRSEGDFEDGDPASQLAQSEEFVGCEERKGRLGRRFAFKFKFGGTFSA